MTAIRQPQEGGGQNAQTETKSSNRRNLTREHSSRPAEAPGSSSSLGQRAQLSQVVQETQDPLKSARVIAVRLQGMTVLYWMTATNTNCDEMPRSLEIGVQNVSGQEAGHFSSSPRIREHRAAHVSKKLKARSMRKLLFRCWWVACLSRSLLGHLLEAPDGSVTCRECRQTTSPSQS